MRILIPILFALLALPVATAVAQEPPATCDPSERGTPGDITTPCVIKPEFEIERLDYRFTPVSNLDIGTTVCEARVVAVLAEGWVLPPRYYLGWVEAHRIGSSDYENSHRSNDGSGEFVLVWVNYHVSSNPSDSRYENHGVSSYGVVSGSDQVPGNTFLTLTPVTDNRVWGHSHTSSIAIPVDEFYAWEANVLRCQADAHQGHLTLKHEVAEAQREAAQASVNAIAEATAAAEEARAKVTAATSERIDAARLESEKQVTATEARELAVVEGMIQASIKVAAEITQIRIDRATARLESLERTATWLRDAAATDLDEWNTYYAEVEQAAIERVEALQVEAAAALEEVQQIQDSLAQDLAASQARQQALTLQLQSQGGVSIEDLQILRQNAVDWVETIDGLIEEAKAESAGE